MIKTNYLYKINLKMFGFEKWKDFDRDLLDRIYNDDSQEREFDYKIYDNQLS